MSVNPKLPKPDYLTEVEDDLIYISFELGLNDATHDWDKWWVILDGMFDATHLRDFADRIDRANAEIKYGADSNV